MIDLIIHDFFIDEWEYQSYSIDYLPIYNSNDLIIINNSDLTINYLNIYLADKLERWPFESLTIENLEITEEDLERWPFESFTMVNVEVYEKIIEDYPHQSLGIDYDTYKIFTLDKWPHESFNMEYLSTKEFNLNKWPHESFNIEYIEVYTANNYDVQNLNWVDRKQSPLKNWGTSDTNTWIMNMDRRVSGSDNTHNTGYYNDTVLNYMIGDMEYSSGSVLFKLCPPESSFQYTDGRRLCEDIEECDAGDWTCQVNRFIYDDGINQDIYQSYFGGTAGNNPIKGRPIGKTTFLATGSGGIGDIIYPVNHYRNYHTSKDQLRHLYYRKTPDNIIKIDNYNNEHSASHGDSVQFKNDLYPKLPVYTLEVEGSDTENILKVETTKDRPLNVEGNPTKKTKTKPSKKGPKT